MTISLQIKGLVRFSYLGPSGFANSKMELEELRAFLYDPARLSRRFDLFEALTLPTLMRQDDTEYQVGFLIGEDFPDVARARLERILAPLPNAQIIALPPMSHYKATQAAFKAMPTAKDTTHVGTFRLDDDDAIHSSMIARIRALTLANLPLLPLEEPFAVGFNRGFFWTLKPGNFKVTEVWENDPIGIGLTLVLPVKSASNVFRRNHRLIPQYYTCITDASKPMFIRTVHDDNDSGAMSFGRDGKMRPKVMNRILRSGFGLTLEQLES